MTGISLLPAAFRELGGRSLLHYGAYALGLRSGRIRRLTAGHRWEDRPLHDWLNRGLTRNQVLLSRERFFFDPWADMSARLDIWADEGDRAVTPEADGILGGEFRPFGGNRVSLGFPPPWNQFLPDAVGQSPIALPADRHWTRYRLDGSTDFKLVWELSRFSWIYPLARAYRLTGENRFWEGCKNLLVSWLGANPPNCGPQWISAQEVAIRLLAMIFAWYAFAPALTEEETIAERLLTAIAVHASRIPPTLSYAKAQRNNHLLVEAVGLYSAGLLFPGFHQAARWKSLGRRTLLAALADQIFSDGGYIQHSVNYHRMALQGGLWIYRLAELHGEPLLNEAREALERMAHCLQAKVEPYTGRAPIYGDNDGSEILPLSSCAYGDQRPTLQAASQLFEGLPGYAAGAWDEFAFWLGLPLHADPGERSTTQSEYFPHAGLYFLRADRSWAMLHCARFRSRPAHSDQLHLDLWWQSNNILLDPGTYRYTAPAPWDHALAVSAAHNGVTIDGRDPMRRAGRFLWLDWDQGEFLGRWRSASGGLELMLAQHDGYAKLGITHRRAVLRAGSDLWLVVDDVMGRGSHGASSAWTFPDWNWQLTDSGVTLEVPGVDTKVTLEPEGTTMAVIRSGEMLAGEHAGRAHPTLGWQSPTYNEIRPALCLFAQTEGELPLRILTWIWFGATSPADLEIAWRPPAVGIPPFTALVWGGEELPL